MWWSVKMTSPKEIHVYPATEAHVLKADRCACRPEVRQAGAVKMIVHKKCTPAPLKPAYKAHWLR